VLNWTAVADNGLTGIPAERYDVRYSTLPIDASTWDSATPLPGIPEPGDPGSAESMQLEGLDYSSTLYFAVRAVDDRNLMGELSNVPSAVTLPPPVITHDPASIGLELAEGTTDSRTITITNDGDYQLLYLVSAEEISNPESESSDSTPPSGASAPESMPDIEATIASLATEDYEADQLLIQYAPGTVTSSAVPSSPYGSDAVRLLDIPDLNMELWEFPGAGAGGLEAQIRALTEYPEVIVAEPNYIYTVEDIPTDPSFSQLYGMHNTGQTGGTPDADIDAPEAWDTFTGSDEVIVAVIDTGIDYTHPDLAANIWTNPGEIAGNGIDDDGNGYVDDIHGYDFPYNDADPMDRHSHGTHVSGTIGAVANNDIGVAGVTHHVKLMAVKFLNDGGSGTTANAVLSVLYAANNGAHLSNNSWGGGAYSTTLKNAIAHAESLDHLFVAAAGNNYRNTDISPAYPASYDNAGIMSIAATDHNDLKAGFSNYGLVTVDLGAPGVNTLSTIPGNRYASKSGTSMAAPHVSGAAALIKGRNMSISALEMKELLMETGDPIASMNGRTVSGKRLNVANAIAEATPPWMELTGELGGALAPDESTEITILFDSTDAAIGDWVGETTILSNDPETPEVIVPITLTVTPDCCAPSAITDLEVSEVTSSHIEITWTATGDDDTTGTATAYDLRYSNSAITEANWADATLVSIPSPAPSGTAESFSLSGINSDTEYWFAIKAVDNSEQWSDLSNIVIAETLAPPTIGTDPESMTLVKMPPNASAPEERTLTISNTGEEPLEYSLRIDGAAAAVSDATLGSDIEVDDSITDNSLNPSDPGTVVNAVTVTGTHLQFGITNYGEVFPFAYPRTREHLRYGNYLSGYTLAYKVGGAERIAYTTNSSRRSISPVSFTTLTNTATYKRYQVVVRTTDNALRITRTFDFDTSAKSIQVNTVIANTSGGDVTDVAFKVAVDWDVDGNSGGNYWDWEPDYNLMYARQTRYAGVAADREPDYRDMYGWDDYSRRLTDQDYTDGPRRMDGLEILHFDMGGLASGGSTSIGTTFAAGDSLEDLVDQLGSIWLTSDTESGTIAPDSSEEITLSYTTEELATGNYSAAITLTTNDPADPSVVVPATLKVNHLPVVDLGGPYVVDEGSRLTFTATGSDADGDNLRYRWDLNNDGRFETSLSDSNEYSYIAPGEVSGTVHVQVSDGNYLVSARADFTVENVPPVGQSKWIPMNEDMPVPLTLRVTDPGWWERFEYRIVTEPQHGTLSGDLPNVTYTPDLNYFGGDYFEYVVNDGTNDSAPARISLTVFPVNDPPVAVNDAATTDEDTAVVVEVISNDFDVDHPNSALRIAAESLSAVNGTVELLADERSVRFTPSANLNSSNTPEGFSFSYQANDGLVNSANTATVAVTVNAVNDAPVFSTASPAAQSIEYSDEIQSITVTAYDIDSATLSLTQSGAPAGISIGAANCVDDGFDGTQCEWTISGAVDGGAGDYTAGLTLSDSALNDAGSIDISVTQETADVIYGDNLADIDATDLGGASGEFTLYASAVETVPDVSNGSPAAGDISRAVINMTLSELTSGTEVSTVCETTLVSGAGYDEQLDVACDFSLVRVGNYSVAMTINGDYYTGEGAAAERVVISDADAGFTTGGGWFYWPGTADDTYFSNVVQYDDNRDQPKGSMNVVRIHRDGRSVRLMQTSEFQGLAQGVNADGIHWSSYNAEVVMQEMGGSTGFADYIDCPPETYYVTVYQEDNGEPGRDDIWWMEVRDANGNIVDELSMTGDPTAGPALEGGNIQLH